MLNQKSRLWVQVGNYLFIEQLKSVIGATQQFFKWQSIIKKLGKLQQCNAMEIN